MNRSTKILIVYLHLIAMLLMSAPLLLAQTEFFYPTPAWYSSESSKATYSMAVGDIDLDGDLDLVCGNASESEPITMYRNVDGHLTVEPVWQAGYYKTYAVALGDIDNDGDLDLVCGNNGQPNVLFLNADGRFESTPAWSSPSSNSTFSIALGDMDNDGDLDLVCGNFSQPNRLYENIGGTFALSASTVSYLNDKTQSIALGDIDGDGFLDVVCGNNSEPNAFYRNSGIPFLFLPEWSSGEANITWDIALGDINGDGTLDLVCANYGQANTLYLNTGATFDTSPAWVSSATKTTSCLALGDMDNDGDLDLACGTYRGLLGTEEAQHTFYENTGALFAPDPVYQLENAANIRAAALCDIDGDGYLDFLCGNANTRNSLYENTGFGFSANPFWVAAQPLATHTVALGDVDRDGDLDLISGEHINQVYGPFLHLYINTAHTLPPTPSWTPDLQLNNTKGAMLGDIDGDGDLDLAYLSRTESGSAFVHANMYPNNGWFTNAPVWRNDYAIQVLLCGALGDISGDGRIDLVLGNPDNVRNSLMIYGNNGQWFSALSLQGNAAPQMTTIALADVNGDRKLDVVGGSFLGVELFLNKGAGFSGGPFWTQDSPDITVRSLAVGDLDGDDDPDLVCGNTEQGTGIGSNAIYRNIGGTFSVTPDIKFFSNVSNNTSDVALVDVDNDGDLDIVFGNDGAQTVSYENRNAIFNDAPEWGTTKTVPPRTYDVALGDMDGDGDLDLVIGNSDAADEIYGGLSNPAYRHDPLLPVRQAGNNPSYIRDVTVVQDDTNRYKVVFSVCDVETDKAWIVCDYRLALQSTWHPAVVLGGQGAQINRTGPYQVQPEGVVDSLVWDVSTVPFSHQDVVLRLRVVEIPSRLSSIQYASSYHKTVEKIVPIRPELTTADAMDFSATALTVGDTLSRDLILTNNGNLELTIDQIDLPSEEMRYSGTLPMTLMPRSSDTVTVYLEPRLETAISGNISITSDDPVTPVKAVAVQTDIRALAVTSKLLSTEPELPLGEAVTVVVTPAPQVRVERGVLFYRSTGASAFMDSVPFSRLEDQFIATIPGAHVREAGLDYFIKMENSGIFVTDPPGAPESGVYQRTVKSPTGITITVPDQFFLSENRRVDIAIALPQGADFVDGSIYFRRGGEYAYLSNPVREIENGFEASITDSMVTNRGVEFWVAINTVSQTLTYPANDPAEMPEMFVVTVTDLHEPHIHAGGTDQSAYRMITIPLYLFDEFTGTIEALLSDQPEFGSYDPMRWRVWYYLPSNGLYQELSELTTQNFRPSLGKVFWLICRENHRISTAPIPGYSNPTMTRSSAFPFSLYPHQWNMVGCPYTYPVLWNSVTADSIPFTEAVGTLIDPPVRFRGGYQYGGFPTLEPFEGYWVYNRSDTFVTLRVPPVEAAEPVVLAPERASAESDGWTITLTAEAPDAKDAANALGTASGSERSLDRNDRFEPPPVPAGGLSLYFIARDSRNRVIRLTTDMRPDPAESFNEGEIWTFDVAKAYSKESGGDAVIIKIAGIDRLPAGLYGSLIDLVLGRTVSLDETTSEYSFYLSTRDYAVKEEDARFRLLIGTEAFVREETDQLIDLPSQAALYQNYPNPFNPATIIRYDVGEPGFVNLRVYDVNGALVRVLEERRRDPGRYEVGWNGENESGNRVGSGVYFYRLRAPGLDETKKMILLK